MDLEADDLMRVEVVTFLEFQPEGLDPSGYSVSATSDIMDAGELQACDSAERRERWTEKRSGPG